MTMAVAVVVVLPVAVKAVAVTTPVMAVPKADWPLL